MYGWNLIHLKCYEDCPREKLHSETILEKRPVFILGCLKRESQIVYILHFHCSYKTTKQFQFFFKIARTVFEVRNCLDCLAAHGI